MDKNNNFLLIFAILMAGIIAYSNSFDCSFHFDDAHFLDASVTTDSATIDDWIRLAPARPLGILTFAVNYNLHKLDVWGYHLVNLTVHLVNALLIWWLTLMTLSTPTMKNEPLSKHKTIIAFLAGFLFVTHPLATQSVTYIVQRFASLATLFYLLSLALFVKGKLWQGNQNISLLCFIASIVSGICGMLAKEIVFTLPFAIILYDFCFLKTAPWKLGFKDKGLIVSFSLLTIFLLLFFRTRSLDIFNTVEAGQGYSYSISIKEYLLTQFRVILTYIRLLLLPINQNFDYDYPISTSIFHVKTFFSFLVLSGIAATGLLLFKKYRLISFGIFWFFLTISIESSIIPISQNVIFEHRTYLPSFGFFIALTGGLFSLFKEKHLQIAIMILLFIAAINATLTYQRNKIWKDDYTLWSDNLKKSPNKARVNNGLGLALFEKGKFKEAIHYYNKAILIKPDYADTFNNRGAAYNGLGQYQRAIEDLNKTIRLDPASFQAYNNLGNTYNALGQYQRALSYYNESIRLKPNYADAYNNRGTLYGKAGQYQLAIADFNKAIILKPDYALAYYNTGFAHSMVGHYNNAIEYFNKAIILVPGYTNAYVNRSVAYFKLGKNSSGCFDAQKACALGNCSTLASGQRIGLCH